MSHRIAGTVLAVSAFGASVGLYARGHEIPHEAQAVDALLHKFAPPLADLPSAVPMPSENPSYICPADVPMCDSTTALATIAIGRFTRVTITQMSPFLTKGAVSSEDRDFYKSPGVNVRRIVGALVDNARAGRTVEGASTIDMQDFRLSRGLPHASSVEEKQYEVQGAEALYLAAPGETSRQKKDSILEDYLNRAYYGLGAYGVEAASQTFFGKSAAEVDYQEAALIIASLRNPLAPSELKRPLSLQTLSNNQARVLDAMAQTNLITPQQALEAKDSVRRPLASYFKPLQPGYHPFKSMNDARAQELQAGHYLDAAIQQVVKKLGLTAAGELGSKGLQIHVTLNTEAQKNAIAAVKAADYSTGDPEVAFVYEGADGDVQAMIGGREYDKSEVNLATGNHRQAGSSQKVFFFANAIRRGRDANQKSAPWPTTVIIPRANGGNDWKVSGDSCTTPNCTLSDALALSSNTVFAQLANQYGVTDPLSAAQKLGLDSDIEPVKAPISSVLGTNGVSVLGLTTAFNGLMTNQGRATPNYFVTAIEDHTLSKTGDEGVVIFKQESTTHEQIIPITAARATITAAKDVIRFGTAAKAFTADNTNPDAFAGKTGTAQNNTDARFTASTCSGTASAWEGYPDAARPMPGHFGAGIPTRVVNTFFLSLPADRTCKLGS